jgi:DNA mismatch endonuclease (patch repair protein)
VRRDALARQRLEELGWRVIVIWGCETGDEKALAVRLWREFGLDAVRLLNQRDFARWPFE